MTSIANGNSISHILLVVILESLTKDLSAQNNKVTKNAITAAIPPPSEFPPPLLSINLFIAVIHAIIVITPRTKNKGVTRFI